jgi:hypothetical protein
MGRLGFNYNEPAPKTHFDGAQCSARKGESIFQKLRRKEDESFIVANPAPSQPPPHILGPGERWLGSIEQNEELEEMSRSGYLFCGVYHSSGKKPVLQRVVIKKSNAT